MDTSISLRLFNWRGDIWLTVDRIGCSDHRKHAPRERLATFHTWCLPEVSEENALLWMYIQLNAWVGDGCPDARREAATVSPGGGTTGGESAARVARQAPEIALPSQTEPPNVERCDGVAVSDGLLPEGEQLALWTCSEDGSPRRVPTGAAYTE